MFNFNRLLNNSSGMYDLFQILSGVLLLIQVMLKLLRLDHEMDFKMSRLELISAF